MRRDQKFTEVFRKHNIPILSSVEVSSQVSSYPLALLATFESEVILFSRFFSCSFSIASILTFESANFLFSGVFS